MPEKQRILVWISNQFSHGYALLRGVYRFTRHRSDWELLRGLDPARDDIAAAVREADGVIAFIDREGVLGALAEGRIPVVNVANTFPQERLPGVSVLNDDEAIGRMAATYFLERGYRSFAYVGVLEKQFSEDREAGFRKALAAYDPLMTCGRYMRPALAASRPDFYRADTGLRQFLAKLPAPTAVFTAADTISLNVLTEAQRLEKRVPEELAILGVNNDELLCESINPPLSSVQIAGEQIGYQAAQTLADLFSGKGKGRGGGPLRLPPLGVVTRPSTDTLAVSDAVVAAAMRFIRERVEQPTTVDDVLDHLTVSRKSLERKFARHLGRTPLEEIRAVHIAHVQSLLAHTDLPMAEVARRGGFARPEHMATVFRAETGQTPTAYRRQFRAR